MKCTKNKKRQLISQFLVKNGLNKPNILCICLPLHEYIKKERKKTVKTTAIQQLVFSAIES